MHVFCSNIFEKPFKGCGPQLTTVLDARSFLDISTICTFNFFNLLDWLLLRQSKLTPPHFLTFHRLGYWKLTPHFSRAYTVVFSCFWTLFMFSISTCLFFFVCFAKIVCYFVFTSRISILNQDFLYRFFVFLNTFHFID